MSNSNYAFCSIIYKEANNNWRDKELVMTFTPYIVRFSESGTRYLIEPTGDISRPAKFTRIIASEMVA